MKDPQELIMVWKESFNKSKKDTTGLKCMKILEDTYKHAMLTNEEEIPKQIIYYIRLN